MGRRSLRRSDAGVAVIEFALLAPVLFLFIIGIAQLGILYLANSGLKHAVGEAARVAAVHPTPPAEEIAATVLSSKYGLDPAKLSEPSIVFDEAGDLRFATIAVSYDVPLNFIFFETDPVRLTETRRVYVYQ